MHGLKRDFAHAVRQLAHALTFSSVAIGTLAVGIGSTTLIFGAVYAVLLRPLPYPKPERLVYVWAHNSSSRLQDALVAPTFNDVHEWAKEIHTIAPFGAFRAVRQTVTGDGNAERLNGAMVNAEFFTVFPTSPELGRPFTEQDMVPGTRVVMISHLLWQRRYASDPDIVGRTLLLDGVPTTIIGVMPSRFTYPNGNEIPESYGFAPRTEIWLPLDLTDHEWSNRISRNLLVIGRLKEGVSTVQAESELEAITGGLARRFPDSNSGWSARVVPMMSQAVAGVKPALTLLLVAVALVLLIACINVANLLIARAISREREIALRVVLGASHWRVAQQLLIESLVLASAGGIGGIIVAEIGRRILISIAPSNIPRLSEMDINTFVLLFALSITFLTGTIFGLIPFLRCYRMDYSDVLRGRITRGKVGTQRARFGLIAGEVGMSVLLLITAGLLIRSFLTLVRVDPGFSIDHAVSFTVRLGPQYLTNEQRDTFLGAAVARIEALPGVAAAGATAYLPLASADGLNYVFIQGGAALPQGELAQVEDRQITPHYFRAMGIALKKGRSFSNQDIAGEPEVVVVNERFIHQFFNGENALGKRIQLGDSKAPCAGCIVDSQVIVGIVGDVRHRGLNLPPRPQVYRPYAQGTRPEMTFVVRGVGDPKELAGAVRHVMSEIDANVPISNVRSMQSVVQDSMAAIRFQVVLVGLLASTALVLSVIGQYGLVCYLIEQRRFEIAVRMALGSTRSQISYMMLKQGIALAAVGALFAGVAFVPLRHLVEGLLFGVTLTDPLIFLLVSLLISGVTLLGFWIPTKRATRLEPAAMLRHE